MENQYTSSNPIQQLLENILEIYENSRANEPFGRENSVWKKFFELVENLRPITNNQDAESLRIKGSLGSGNWADIPWIAIFDTRETNTIQKGIYFVFLFRKDMSGVYLTFNQGVTELINQHGVTEASRILRETAIKVRENCKFVTGEDFLLDNDIDLKVEGGLGENYQVSTIAYKLYEKNNIPDDQTILEDIDTVLKEYDLYIKIKNQIDIDGEETEMTLFDYNKEFKKLLEYIDSSGFVFEPWQVAAYVTALRTKPFVILAGISGTGKSKLPALVAKGTGGQPNLISVKPDWTDSSDILGYVNLQDEFQPGLLLRLAKNAQQPENQDNHYVVIIDEMNIARVEHYFAEVLSQIENRKPDQKGGFTSEPLIVQNITRPDDQEWSQVCLPSNLAIVGTVNMDESTHGFSKKVLDRAFTIEISDIDLSQLGNFFE